MRAHAPWLAALVVTLGGGSYYAVASGVTSSPSKKIYACVTADYKTLNLSSAGRECPDGQRKISWNAEGRRGVTGKPGPKGTAGRTTGRGQRGSDH